MKILTKPLVLSLAALLGFALNASAQGTEAPVPGSSYGLVGTEYVGVAFGYTDLDNGPPNAMRSFEFLANRPTEIPNVDASFKYEYSRVSAFGIKGHEHDFLIGGTAYRTFGAFKPFIEGNVGWAFSKVGPLKSDSFVYLISGGAEFQVLPRLAVTPYISYSEAPHFNARGWDYGVKGTYRFAQEWSGTAGIEFDDDSNVEYRVGVNRHF